MIFEFEDVGHLLLADVARFGREGIFLKLPSRHNFVGGSFPVLDGFGWSLECQLTDRTIVISQSMQLLSMLEQQHLAVKRCLAYIASEAVLECSFDSRSLFRCSFVAVLVVLV